MTRYETIEAHVSFHLYQIKLEADAARKKIKRLVEFTARSQGQKRRYSKLNFKGEVK